MTIRILKTLRPSIAEGQVKRKWARATVAQISREVGNTDWYEEVDEGRGRGQAAYRAEVGADGPKRGRPKKGRETRNTHPETPLSTLVDM